MPLFSELIDPYIAKVLPNMNFGKAPGALGRMFTTGRSEALGRALAIKDPAKLLDVHNTVPRLKALWETRNAAGAIAGAEKAGYAKQVANETVEGGLKHLFPDLTPGVNKAMSNEAKMDGINRIRGLKKVGFKKKSKLIATTAGQVPKTIPNEKPIEWSSTPSEATPKYTDFTPGEERVSY